MTITATIIKTEQLSAGRWRVFVNFLDTVSLSVVSRDYRWSYATILERQTAANAIAAKMEARLAPDELEDIGGKVARGADPEEVPRQYNTRDDVLRYLAAELFNRMRDEYVSDTKYDEINARRNWIDPYTNQEIAALLTGWSGPAVGNARSRKNDFRAAVLALDHGKDEIVI